MGHRWGLDLFIEIHFGLSRQIFQAGFQKTTTRNLLDSIATLPPLLQCSEMKWQKYCFATPLPSTYFSSTLYFLRCRIHFLLLLSQNCMFQLVSVKFQVFVTKAANHWVRWLLKLLIPNLLKGLQLSLIFWWSLIFYGFHPKFWDPPVSCDAQNIFVKLYKSTKYFCPAISVQKIFF